VGLGGVEGLAAAGQPFAKEVSLDRRVARDLTVPQDSNGKFGAQGAIVPIR